jgi:hypothetical protein
MSALRLLPSLLHRRQLWRAGWAAVFLLHLPLTLKVLSAAWVVQASSYKSSSLLLLLLANLFFLIEVGFAPTLRLLTNRRKAVAFALVILLLHVGVIEQRTGFVVEHEALYCLLVGAAGALQWRRLVTLAKRVAQFLDLPLADDTSRQSRRAVPLDFLPIVHDPSCTRNAVPLRAPPRA